MSMNESQLRQEREDLIGKTLPLVQKLGHGNQLSPAERTALDTWQVRLRELNSEIPVAAVSVGSMGVHRSQTVVVNSEGKVQANNIPPATFGKIVSENPFSQNLYADKKCSGSWLCRNTVHWRVTSGKFKDPYANDGGLPRGVQALGPAVMDSLQAQLEFAEGSMKNRPMGGLVKEDAEYFCEKHYREREIRLSAAAEAETAKQKAEATPHLWSMDPTGVRVDLKDDGNFLLVFPDGFEMTWEGFRADELTAWRKHGRRVPR